MFDQGLQSKQATADLRLPPLSIGFVASLGIFVFEVLAACQCTPLSFDFRYDILLWLTVLLYWLICVWGLHAALERITSGAYPINPVAAAAYHVIPFFNLYWVFRWPGALSEFLNTHDIRTASQLVLGGLILVSLLIGRLGWPVIEFLVLFGVLAYLYKRVRTLALQTL